MRVKKRKGKDKGKGKEVSSALMLWFLIWMGISILTYAIYILERIISYKAKFMLAGNDVFIFAIVSGFIFSGIFGLPYLLATITLIPPKPPKP